MKKITLMAAMFAALAMNAQTTFYSDNFDDEDISDWAVYDEDGDASNWGDLFAIEDGDGNPVTPISLISRSWSGAPLFPDNWAVTPSIDLTTATGTITLDWKVQAAAATWDNEKYSVYVGISNDIADLESSAVTFTEVYDDPDDLGTQYDRTLDLSSFAGESVFIAFRHHDVSDMDFLSIDDVMVTGGSLSVADNDFNGFNYYVANNQLKLSASTSMEKVALYNVVGQQVIAKNLANTSETINLSELQSGIYLATVSIDGNSKTFKIVKN